MIVLVGGRAGEGKTTFCKYCLEVIDKLELEITSDILPFAKKVKDTARFMGWDSNKDDKGRALLQQIGKAGRAYDKDIWVKAVADLIITEKLDVVFIDDWRFPNEVEVIYDSFPNEDVHTVRMRRPKEKHTLWGTELYNDISEASLPENNDYYDLIIDNSSSLADLKEQALWFVEDFVIGG